MEIRLKDVPEDGLPFEGELPPSIFDLEESDPIRPVGPVHFEGQIYVFEEVIAIAGRLWGGFQLQCGTCLEYFDYEADFPDWSLELDREAGVETLDLAVLVREDFLLNLPTHPRCDEFVEGRICPRAHVLASDEDLSPPSDEGQERNAWGALDDWK